MQELTTNQKGTIAETHIIADAVELGLGVLRPVADASRYDLVFDLGDRLLRVQCKWANREGDVVVVRSRTSRQTTRGASRTTYSADEVDAVAA